MSFRERRGLSWPRIIAAVMLLSLAAWLIVRGLQNQDTNEQATAVPSTVAATSTSSSAPTPPSTTTSTNSSAPVVLNPVAASPPTGLAVAHSEIGTITAAVSAMPFNSTLNPPTGDVAYWVDGMGQAPAYPSERSTFIAGHSWSQRPDVFNALSIYATARMQGKPSEADAKGVLYGVVVMEAGSLTASVETATGVLTYRLTEALYVRKADTSDLATLRTYTPNRLVIVTCSIGQQADGSLMDYDYNIVFLMELVSSFPK